MVSTSVPKYLFDLDLSRTPESEYELNICKHFINPLYSYLFKSDGPGKWAPLQKSGDLRQWSNALFLCLMDAHLGDGLSSISADNISFKRGDVDPELVRKVALAFVSIGYFDLRPTDDAEPLFLGLTGRLSEEIRGWEFAVLNRSRNLDVHKWSEHPEADVFVSKIYKENFKGGNVGIRKKHIKVLLLDLYVAWLDDPALKIAVSMNVNDYKPRSRYNALHISRLMPEIIDVLAEARLIHRKVGFFDKTKGEGFLTRIWPTAILRQMFREARFGLDDIVLHQDRECIVLRDNSDKEIEYEDTDETNAMRGFLCDYNNLIARSFIDIPTLDTNQIPMGEETQPLLIRDSAKFTRRVFNRGSFQKGGRFYGGWWQNCPKGYRHQIFIDDHPVSEVDYSGLHIALLYANEGIAYSALGIGDAYTLDPGAFENGKVISRDVVKELALVAINASDEKSAFKAFRDGQTKGSTEKAMKDSELLEILEAFKEKHAPIAHMIASDAGIDLMNQDSKITELILRHFTEQDIPVLAIHDSYLVPMGMERALKEAMARAFEQVTGISNDKLKDETHNPWDFEPLDEVDASGMDMKVWEMAIRYREDPKRTARYMNAFDQHKVRFGPRRWVGYWEVE